MDGRQLPAGPHLPARPHLPAGRGPGTRGNYSKYGRHLRAPRSGKYGNALLLRPPHSLRRRRAGPRPSARRLAAGDSAPRRPCALVPAEKRADGGCGLGAGGSGSGRVSGQNRRPHRGSSGPGRGSTEAPSRAAAGPASPRSPTVGRKRGPALRGASRRGAADFEPRQPEGSGGGRRPGRSGCTPFPAQIKPRSVSASLGGAPRRSANTAAAGSVVAAEFPRHHWADNAFPVLLRLWLNEVLPPPITEYGTNEECLGLKKSCLSGTEDKQSFPNEKHCPLTTVQDVILAR
ncbi:uncharacterized protein LOC142363606 [Opisthocomus hoazin]|uniref:uncharacterized protein LOC142363606 n=1 Tax=Opisthocomus hoazin TaxID=30419 RepID=UPI003F52B3C8